MPQAALSVFDATFQAREAVLYELPLVVSMTGGNPADPAHPWSGG